MRRFILGVVSTLVLTCPVLAEEAVTPQAAPPPGVQAAPAEAAIPQAAPPATLVAMATGATAPAAPSAPHVYQEGQKLELAGTLYSTRDGRIVLKTETGEIFVILENQNLWRMEQRAAFGEREFRVKGQLSKYQERYYLSVSKIVETAIKLKDKKDPEPEEKPIWERLMFWKNS